MTRAALTVQHCGKNLVNLTWTNTSHRDHQIMGTNYHTAAKLLFRKCKSYIKN